MNWLLKADSELALKAALVVVFIVLCVFLAWVSDYNWPTGTGNLCMIMFIVANAYFPFKRLRIVFMFKDERGFIDKYIKLHSWLNAAMFAAACIHCYVTRWENSYLWYSLIIMGWMTVGGFIMKFKYPPAVRKGLYILHTQQFLFFVLCFFLLKGHYVI